MRYIFLLFISFPVFAHHHGESVTNHYYGDGTALSIATSQHQFDWATNRWQGSVGIGSYDNEEAFSFGLGKKWCNDCPLINGSIGSEDGKTGAGIGINFRF